MLRSPVMAPLLPKLRGQFAEFLNHSSPDRLSIFYLTTCVGFGYGPYIHIARGFSRQHRITNFPKYGYASRLTLYVLRIYLEHGPHAYTTISITWHGYLPASPHHLATTSSGPQHHTHQPPRKAAKGACSGGLVSLIHHGRGNTGTGISTRYPSTTPVGLALGPD